MKHSNASEQYAKMGECSNEKDGAACTNGSAGDDLPGYEKLSGNALKCMYAVSVVEIVIIAGIAAALNLFVFFPYDLWWGKVISLIVFILSFADAAISPWFRYHRYGYRIDEECIDIREGYLFVNRDIVPIERLHKLKTNRGPIDRMFGVAKVEVTTAGGDVTIRFLQEETAEKIAESLMRRINTIAVGQRNNEITGSAGSAEGNGDRHER